jgi:hypothetical protein
MGSVWAATGENEKANTKKNDSTMMPPMILFVDLLRTILAPPSISLV